MTDEFEDIDPEDENGYIDPQAVQRQRQRIKTLEKEQKALAEQAAAGQSAVRKLAFIEAGIDLSDPKTKFFADKFDGELTAEAIKTAATEFGFLDAPPPDNQATDLATHQRMSQVVQGGAPTGVDADLQTQIANAQSPEELTALLEANGRKVSLTQHQQ